MQGLTLNAAISSPAITIEARVKTFFKISITAINFEYEPPEDTLMVESHYVFK